MEAAFTLLRRGDPPTPERVESLGGGWVGEEALAIACYCWNIWRVTAARRVVYAASANGWRATERAGESGRDIVRDRAHRRVRTRHRAR